MLVIIDRDGETLCTVGALTEDDWTWKPTDQANAALLAAAPELLEASRALLSMLAVWLPAGEASADYVYVWDAAEKVEQAITKARGDA
jgi:hypothetical protein